jgi:aryl carrier-like protein
MIWTATGIDVINVMWLAAYWRETCMSVAAQ